MIEEGAERLEDHTEEDIRRWNFSYVPNRDEIAFYYFRYTKSGNASYVSYYMSKEGQWVSHEPAEIVEPVFTIPGQLLYEIQKGQKVEDVSDWLFSKFTMWLNLIGQEKRENSSD
jgi:hypothetical protein